MTESGIENANRLVMDGRIDDALELLRPLVRETFTKADALGVMGLAYQRTEKIALACYIYEEALILDPEQETASKWIHKCRETAQELMVHENFDDFGHVACMGCQLKYRIENPICPYCDVPKGETTLPPEPEEEEPEPELSQWEDSPLDKVEEAGRAALRKVKEVAASDAVKEAAQRAQALGREAAAKAKEFAESDTVKAATKKAEKLGKDVSEKIQKLGDKEKVKKFTGKAREVFNMIAADIRKWVKAERRKYELGSPSEKQTLFAKWIAMGIGVILLLGLLNLLF